MKRKEIVAYCCECRRVTVRKDDGPSMFGGHRYRCTGTYRDGDEIKQCPGIKEGEKCGCVETTSEGKVFFL